MEHRSCPMALVIIVPRSPVPMPRYYLHIHNGHDLERDPEGADYPTLVAARAAAEQVIREIWVDWPEARYDMAVEIVGEAGQTVLQVPFADVIVPMQ
jgi:hypothetical protein